MIKYRWSWILMLLAGLAGNVLAVNLPTAKEAKELANSRFVSGAQNQVIRIIGTYSDGDLKPRRWDVTLFDGRRGHNATVVRVRDGVVVSATGSIRLFDDARWSHFGRNFTGYDPDEVINQQRWKLDSPEALTRVLSLPALANVQVTEVVMTLRKLSDGDVPPVWRIALRARSRAVPRRQAWIGYVDLNAETGDILANETRVGKLVR
jgi:hypothetical protein